MKLYVLKSNAAHGWDTARGFVVAAPNAGEARILAASRCGDEGQGTWMGSDGSTCVCVADVTTYTEPTVVLRDFNQG